MATEWSLDYLNFSNLIPLTYYVRLADDSFDSPVSLSNCQQILINKKYIGSDLKDKVVGFNLWSNELGTLVPKRADKIITTDNSTWIVDNVMYDSMADFYQAECFSTKN